MFRIVLMITVRDYNKRPDSRQGM